MDSAELAVMEFGRTAIISKEAQGRILMLQPLPLGGVSAVSGLQILVF